MLNLKRVLFLKEVRDRVALPRRLALLVHGDGKLTDAGVFKLQIANA